MPPEGRDDPSGPEAVDVASPRPVWFRWAVYAGIALILAVLAGSLATLRAVRDALPRTDGTVEVTGLQSTVAVRRDAAGVPHVTADSATDLFFGQGYVQAQDRFAQMDLRRLAAEGRLSELFGRRTLERDQLARALDWERLAQRELQLLRPRTVAWLRAFSDGVNAYLGDQDAEQLSLEYDLLRLQGVDHRPERWTPLDSLMWFKVSSWSLRADVQDEIDRVSAATALSVGEVDDLYPVPDQESGNAWAVSGDRTASGAPLLAADPHAPPTLPGPWYQIGLHCSEVDDDCPFDVTGFAYPGSPGVVQGHNGDLAWAAIPSQADVADLYLEAVDGGRYLRDGRYVEFAQRDEVIGVRGEDAFTFQVRSTVHGPVLSDVDQTYASVGANAPDGGYDRSLDDVLGSVSGIPRGDYAVSLAWTALRPGRSLQSVLDADQARTWQELRRALRGHGPPRQVVHADRAGHIGLLEVGQVPVRRGSHEAGYPASGWDSDLDWRPEPLPPDRLASVLDPPGGVVVAGTQGRAAYAARRVQLLLSQAGSMEVPDALEVQLDTRHGFAARLVPLLLEVDVGGRYFANAQVLLRDWDHDQPADSAAASYFNAVWSNLLRLTFDDQLPASVAVSGGERWWRVVDRLLDQPASHWWDDVTTHDVQERRDDVLLRAMRDARDELTRLESRTASRWTWGHQHSLTLENQTLGQSGSGLVRRLLNRGEWEVPGGTGAVAGGDIDVREGYEVVRAPSMRMVVSLADVDDSRWVALGGASGHAFAEHYTDQTDLWVRGRTLPWVFGEDAVAGLTEQVLVLRPGSSG